MGEGDRKGKERRRREKVGDVRDGLRRQGETGGKKRKREGEANTCLRKRNARRCDVIGGLKRRSDRKGE